MILDILFAITLIWAIYTGLKKGIIHSLFFFISFVIGTLVSLKFSHLLSEKLEEWFTIDPTYLPLISFVILFGLTVYGVILLANALEKVLKMLMLNLFNRIAGAVFWAVIGLFLLSTAFWYAKQYELITEEMTKSSLTFEYVEPLSPYLIDKAGALMPFFQDIYDPISNMIQFGN